MAFEIFFLQFRETMFDYVVNSIVFLPFHPLFSDFCADIIRDVILWINRYGDREKWKRQENIRKAL